MIKILIIVISIKFAALQLCPISKSDCSNIICSDMIISCENDYSIYKIPVFNETNLKLKNDWQEIKIRNTNITRIHLTSFKEFIENSSKIILLDLSNNQIEFIENGAFMVFRHSIRKLILNNNRLIEFQFESFLSIRLEELFINNNKLKDFHVVDNNKQEMHLNSLHLNRNNLSILPSSIKLFTSLKNLDLSFNPLVTLPKFAFDTLILLEMLNLNGLDSLCCLNSETFSGLNNLRFLYLTAPSQNYLEPNICWFSNLIMLKEFSYNITKKRNVSLETKHYDYCDNNLCWIYLLKYFKNISVINPNCILVNSKINIYENLCKINESNSLCDSNRDLLLYGNSSANSTTSSNNNSIILGSVLGSVSGFLILIMIISVLIYYKRKRKCCFKQIKKHQNKKDEIGKYSPDLEFNRNNPLYFNNNLVRQEAPDDDYLNNIGSIVNIIELSDSSLTTFDFVDNNLNTNKNVRFDSNVLVISNLSNNDASKTNEKSLSSEHYENETIQTIYEDDLNDESASSTQNSFIKNIKIFDVRIEDTSVNDTVNSSINTKL
jgi:hypothetical protein